MLCRGKENPFPPAPLSHERALAVEDIKRSGGPFYCETGLARRKKTRQLSGFLFGGGRTPGLPPVRALHRASLRVRTQCTQVHCSAPKNEKTSPKGEVSFWGRADSNRRTPKRGDLQSPAIAAMRHPRIIQKNDG